MARIEFTDAEGQIKRFEIPATASGVVLGRSPSCNIVIPSQSVGRNHAKITCDGGSFVYTDLGSVNGSFINNQRVTEPVRLRDGDTLRLGEVILRFYLGTRTAAPPKSEHTLRDDDKPRTPEPRKIPQGPVAPASKLAESQRIPQAPAPAARPDAMRPVTDAVAMGELARLRKENLALRAELQSLQSKVSSAESDAAEIAVLRRQIEELRASSSDSEAKRLKAALADAERHAREAENRAAMASSSLESIHSKYMEAREEARHLSSLLEKARAEAQDREIEAMELREKLQQTEAELDALRGRGVEAAEEVKALKVKLTQKDRELEGLRRELDSREYDIKALREENERLEEYCQSDSGRQRELERKVKNLEAVIEENRNLVRELRRALEEKDREVREIRLGVGIADLEQEKQRLLDDYHKKSRELDALRAELASAKSDIQTAAAEREELLGRIRQLEEAARVRRSEREDISDHPDYRAKVREAEALAEALRAREAELSAREKALEERERERANLMETLAARDKELAERNRTIERLNRDLAQAAEAAKAVSVVKEQVLPEGLAEAVESLMDSLVLFQSGIREVESAVRRASGSVPSEVEEALASLRDLRRVVAREAESVKVRLK